MVNTGYVSNLTNQNDYYYNSSVAHAFYNATCSIPREGTYLHGEVVSLGVLVLFAYTGDTENLERYAAFNKQMGLPVTLEQVGLSEADIPALCEYAHATNEWKQGNPEPSPTRSSPPPSSSQRLRPHPPRLTYQKGQVYFGRFYLANAIEHLLKLFSLPVKGATIYSMAAPFHLLFQHARVKFTCGNHTVPVTQQQVDEDTVARGERAAKGAIVDATCTARGTTVL